MTKTIGIQLALYSLLLAGLSYLGYQQAPILARPVLITGLIGGALCLVWGLRAIAGNRGKALAILTLIPVNFMMFSQTVLVWGERTQDVAGSRSATVLITLLFVLSITMLMRIVWTGVVIYGQQVSPMEVGGAKSQATEEPAAKAHAPKRSRGTNQG